MLVWAAVRAATVLVLRQAPAVQVVAVVVVVQQQQVAHRAQAWRSEQQSGASGTCLMRPASGLVAASVAPSPSAGRQSALGPTTGALSSVVGAGQSLALDPPPAIFSCGSMTYQQAARWCLAS